MSQQSSSQKALGLLLILGITWSLGYSIARYCTTNGVNPLGYAFWQSLGPAIILTAICFVLKIPPSLKRQAIFFYLFAGLIGISLPNANIYFSAQHLPAGILAVVINTVPLFTYLLALAFKEETFHQRRFAGVILTFIGLLVLAQPHVLLEKSAAPWLFSALLTPLAFSLCAVFISKYRPDNSHSLSLASGMLCASTLWLTPVVIVLGHFYWIQSFAPMQNRLIVLEIALSSFGYWILFILLRKAGAVYYSLVGGIVAIAGLLWGYIFFGESQTIYSLLAITSIIAGITCVAIR
jgi:drug/metabolite transporter (DMT)-like permease